jgi:hypothetical protein
LLAKKAVRPPQSEGIEHGTSNIPGIYCTFTVPDMRVQGQLTCLEVKKENKKKDCKLCM